MVEISKQTKADQLAADRSREEEKEEDNLYGSEFEMGMALDEAVDLQERPQQPLLAASVASLYGVNTGVFRTAASSGIGGVKRSSSSSSSRAQPVSTHVPTWMASTTRDLTGGERGTGRSFVQLRMDGEGGHEVDVGLDAQIPVQGLRRAQVQMADVEQDMENNIEIEPVAEQRRRGVGGVVVGGAKTVVGAVVGGAKSVVSTGVGAVSSVGRGVGAVVSGAARSIFGNSEGYYAAALCLSPFAARLLEDRFTKTVSLQLKKHFIKKIFGYTTRCDQNSVQNTKLRSKF